MKRSLSALLVVLILLVVASPAWAAPTFDAYNANAASSTNTLTISHTAASGATIAVQVIIKNTPPPTVSTLRYNGVDLVLERTNDDAGVSFRAECYALLNAGDGSAHNLVVTLSGSAASILMSVSSWTGVTSTADASPGGNNSGTGTSSATSVTTGAGQVVVDFLSIAAGNTPTMGGSQTTLNTDHALGVGIGNSYRNDVGSYDMTATWTGSAFWIHQAVMLIGATTGLFRSQGDLTGVGTGGKFHKDPLQ